MRRIAQFVSNYMIEPPVLATHAPALASPRCEEMFVAHGMNYPGAPEGGWAWYIRRTYASSKKHLSIVMPPLPIPYGTHHTKMFVLVYADGGVRVVVHSANLISVDLENKAQVAWHQDFAPKRPGAASTSAFEHDLVSYLRTLEMHRAGAGGESVEPWRRFLDNVVACDYACAKATLVTSVPGYHRGKDMDLYGHMKIRRLLAQHAFPAKFKQAPICCQYSSLGSLTSNVSASCVHPPAQAPTQPPNQPTIAHPPASYLSHLIPRFLSRN